MSCLPSRSPRSDIWSVPDGELADRVCKRAFPVSSLRVSQSDMRTFMQGPWLTPADTVSLPVTFRHGLGDQERGWHYSCRGEEDVILLCQARVCGWGCGGGVCVCKCCSASYSGTQATIKLYFLSGLFEKQYAFLKHDDKEQKRLCLRSSKCFISMNWNRLNFDWLVLALVNSEEVLCLDLSLEHHGPGPRPPTYNC